MKLPVASILFSIGFMASVSESLASDFFDPLDGQLDLSNYLSENAYGLLPVPIIITDPAVAGGLGVVGLFFHESESEKEARIKAMRSSDGGAQQHIIPPSVSAIAVAATGNDSLFAGGGHMGFFKQGKVRYVGGGGYGDVNLDFYGSGDIGAGRAISLNTEAVMVMQKLKFKTGDLPLFVGVTQRYVSAEITPNSLGNLEALLPPEYSEQLTALLTQDVATSGLGLLAEWDSRDNVFSPKTGYHYELEQVWYRNDFGSDVDYDLTHIEGRNYWQLADSWLLGFRFDSSYADSDGLLPPFATPAVDLRGIPAMRYQGKFVGALETELTWQIDRRWSVKAFTGAARASNAISSFSDADTLATFGGGFRYQIARRYGFDMGVDLARGPDDTVFYITAGSAW